jgi:cytochrome c peroxidase
MRAVAAALAVVTLACATETPSPPPRPSASSAAPAPKRTELGAARQRALARAKEVERDAERLRRATRERRSEAAIAELIALRRAWRRIEPPARVLAPVGASQIDPELEDEPDEILTRVGLRVLGDALAEKQVDWARVDEAVRATENAVKLATRELQTASWDLRRLGVALSRAVFEWGRRLDGSQAESDAELVADVKDGGRALVEWTELLLGELRARAPERAAAFEPTIRDFERWIAEHGDAPSDKLAGLVLSGELGAAVRRMLVALGEAPVRAPFPPARRTRASDHEEPVHLATFPALAGPALRPARVELGAELFFDTRLSREQNLSCATCHRIEHGLAAGPRRPRAFDGKPLARDVPALWNAAYEPMHFWDGRASTLADQVRIAVENDMGGRWDEIVRLLSADAELERRFRRAFGKGIDAANVRLAIEEFERTLVSDATPLDRFVRGERAAMTDEMRRGFDVYFGKARCSRCHRMPLTSGATAPRFVRTEASAIGVPGGPRSRTLDPDRGRGEATKRAIDVHAFKVPTLRNLAKTAPYFHNGSFATLEQVVKFYEDGSGAGLGIVLENFDPDAAAFALTTAERRALVVFLRDGLRDAEPAR